MKALALTLLFSCCIVAANAADTLKARIETSNKPIHQAMLKKDFPTLEKLFKATCTADFKYVDNAKSPPQNLTQMIQNMKMGISSMKKMTKVDSKVISCTEKGSTGMSKSMHLMEGTVAGPDKKDHKMTFSGIASESYVKVKGKWMMSRMSWDSQKMSMDGKPMGAPPMATTKKG
jgi:hypothetical protein